MSRKGRRRSEEDKMKMIEGSGKLWNLINENGYIVEVIKNMARFLRDNNLKLKEFKKRCCIYDYKRYDILFVERKN